VKTGNQKQLAAALGLTERRIRQLEDERVLEKVDGDRSLYDLGSSKRRYQVYSSGNLDTVTFEIERASDDLSAILADMEAAPVPNRMPMARKVGPAMAALGGWLHVSAAMLPKHERPLIHHYIDLELYSILHTVMSLLNVRLDTSDLEA
jgi:hypothetical protein